MTMYKYTRMKRLGDLEVTTSVEISDKSRERVTCVLLKELWDTMRHKDESEANDLNEKLGLE